MRIALIVLIMAYMHPRTPGVVWSSTVPETLRFLQTYGLRVLVVLVFMCSCGLCGIAVLRPLCF